MNDIASDRVGPMLNPPHLGELLRESMDEVGWNVTETATRLGCERGTLSRLLNGKAGVSASMALSLEDIGWGTADHWMRMQASYELAQARLDRAAAERRAAHRTHDPATRPRRGTGDRPGCRCAPADTASSQRQPADASAYAAVYLTGKFMPLGARMKTSSIRRLRKITDLDDTLMPEQDSLLETVASLIIRRCEGTYWDFKRRHHTNRQDLIHDILCLANAKHRGRRFLIFGVDDTDFSLRSISDDPGRRTQADTAGLFRDNASKFFQSRFPDFYLAEVAIDRTLLDVLVIEDMPHKPYYLVEKYKTLRAHHIYTRVCDTNTPATDAAQPHEIERMWRERFGLDL